MARLPAALNASGPGRITISLALLLFAVLAVANGLDRLSPRAPALARFVPPPLQAQAWRARAAQAVVRDQPKTALVMARRAVAADPVDPAATGLLGTAYLMNQRPTQAEAAFRVAARFGWREPATQAYWYQAALQSGELALAVDRVDALLRTHPDLPARDLLLAPLESTSQGRAALAVRMAGRPDWLTGYLHPDAELGDAAFARRTQVLLELAEAGTQLGCDAVAPFVTQALVRGARRDAERVWTRHCAGASVTGGVADPGFEEFGRNGASPFGWQAGQSGDVALRVVDKSGGGRALAMRNRGTVSRMVLSQAVSLAPGNYRLTGQVAPDRVAGSVGCGVPPGLPRLGDGDMATGGQVLRVPACSRLELGLWLRPGGDETELDSIVLERVR